MSSNVWQESAKGGASRFAGALTSALKSPIFWATAGLFLVSWILAPGSLSKTGIDALLPFAAVMALAAVGQTVVIMLKGIDLSVPGMVTIGALVTSQFSHETGNLALALLLVLVIAVIVGSVNGIVIAFFSVSPLVVTLAMNSILMGAMLAYTGGTPSRAAPALVSFAAGRLFGVSNVVWAVLLAVLVISLLVSITVWGQRVSAVGANEDSARVAAVRVNHVRISGYVLASLCYAGGGVLLAGFLTTPTTQVGAPYLMPVIAAVVLGGTSLLGGRGMIWGSVLGALFLSQLTQLVLSLGAPSSVQYIVQALVIFVAVTVSLSTENKGIMNALTRRRKKSQEVPKDIEGGRRKVEVD